MNSCNNDNLSKDVGHFFNLFEDRELVVILTDAHNKMIKQTWKKHDQFRCTLRKKWSHNGSILEPFWKYSSPRDLGTNKILTTVLDGIFEYPYIVALNKNIGSPGHPWAFSRNMVPFKNVVKLISQKNIGTSPLGPALKTVPLWSFFLIIMFVLKWYLNGGHPVDMRMVPLWSHFGSTFSFQCNNLLVT